MCRRRSSSPGSSALDVRSDHRRWRKSPPRSAPPNSTAPSTGASPWIISVPPTTGSRASWPPWSCPTSIADRGMKFTPPAMVRNSRCGRTRSMPTIPSNILAKARGSALSPSSMSATCSGIPWFSARRNARAHMSLMASCVTTWSKATSTPPTRMAFPRPSSRSPTCWDAVSPPASRT